MTDEKQRVYWEKEHGFRAPDHPIVAGFARQRIRFLDRWISWKDCQNGLDVGCGSGFSTLYLRDRIRDLSAMDRSSQMLAAHPLQGQIPIVSGDARALPYEDRSFDFVMAWEVLHHISEPKKVVDEMARVTRQYLVFAEPNPFNPAQAAFAMLDPEHRWVFRFTPRMMRSLVDPTQFEILFSGSGGWIFPNKTPTWLYPILAQLPYSLPGIGITNWIVAKRISTPVGSKSPRGRRG